MKLLTAGLAAALFSVGLSAYDGDCQCEPCSTIYLGGSYTRSHIDPSGFSNYDGNMGGLQGMYQYRPLGCVYVAIGGFWRAGKNSGSTGKRDLIDAGVHERIGYTFAMWCDQISHSLYTGFGYRHLAHHVKPNIGSKIELRYNEFFIPVGLRSIYDISSCFSIGLDATWMPQVFSTVTFDVVDDARFVIKNTYKNFKVTLPLYFHFACTCWSVMLNPFFEYWQDGRTTAKTQFNDPLGLPKNTYTFWGVELNLQYAF